MNDLSQFNPAAKTDGAVMVLKHPGNGTPLMEGKEPVSITLLSTDSDVARKLLHEQSEKQVNNQLGRRRPHVSMVEIEQNTIRLLSALTVSWQHITVDGQDVPFSTENAVTLYTRFAWIREQVDVFVNDRAQFLGN